MAALLDHLVHGVQHIAEVVIGTSTGDAEATYNKRAEKGLEADVVFAYPTKDDPKAEEEEDEAEGGLLKDPLGTLLNSQQKAKAPVSRFRSKESAQAEHSIA